MSPHDVLCVPPTPVNLADNFDFQQTQIRGVSLAVDADARSRIAAAGESAKLGATAIDTVPFLIMMLGQDRTSAASADMVAAFRAGRATTEDGRKAENMIRLAEADAACQVAASDALAVIGAPAVTALIEALKIANPNARSGAAKALGQIGAPAESSLPFLNELTKTDPAETVRKAASDAAKKIKPRTWFSF